MLFYTYYLLKVIICSGILLGYYWLLLRDKIFHHYNRFYLLVVVIVSLALPLIQIDIWHSANAPAPGIKLLKVVTGSNEYLDEIVLTARHTNFTFTAEEALWLLYLSTCVVFCYLFIKMLLNIRMLLKQHPKTTAGDIVLVSTTAKGTPFSFFSYIFWNTAIDIKTVTGSQILRHELVHVQQKHSYDKLFINVALIFFWCNPFFWLLRKELDMIHEFMADKIAVEDSDTEVFAAMILQATYPQYRFPLTSSFFYSPIKRRLIMLTKNKNLQTGYIGRLLVLPLAVFLFAAFTLKTKTFKNVPALHYKGKKITIVLDAGHGGKDFGARSIDGNIAEKDITLSIIKKIQSLNTDDNIRIVLTRENDVYKSPQERAAFTKAVNADLFITIHTDAASRDAAKIKTGMSVWVAKNEYANAADSKLFASAIINEFNNDYKLPVTSLPQQQQGGIWVLQESACPATLIEAGYITNKKDLAYLETDEAKEAIARNVLAAITKYAIQKDVAGGTALYDTVPKSNLLKPTPQNYQLSQEMLYVVDGKIIGAGKTGRDKLNLLNIKKIKTLNVLEITMAINKYGKQGEHGAIEITTIRALDKGDTNLDFELTKGTYITQEPVNEGAVSKSKNDQSGSYGTPPEPGKIFTKVENEPEFPGGDTAWRRYLETNLQPDMPVIEAWKPGSYKITVTFIVNKDGSLTDIKTDDFQGSKTAQQCIDLIKKGPKWKPAVQNDRVVTAYRKQAFTFVVNN